MGFFDAYRLHDAITGNIVWDWSVGCNPDNDFSGTKYVNRNQYVQPTRDLQKCPWRGLWSAPQANPNGEYSLHIIV